MNDKTVSEIGEKALIATLIRPLFDGGAGPPFLGDDCAALAVPVDHDVLLSTDRVPADLIAFRLRLIDHFGLGRYLAFLNISDIAASGGDPAGLLLNMGIPPQLRVADFEAICRGFHEVARQYGIRVVGGDISSSIELSLSATSVGFVPRGEALKRDGAKPGDHVFLSRALGLTPAAFTYFLSLHGGKDIAEAAQEQLKRQFTDIAPLVALGRFLRTSQVCTACMDNTDGVAQSLFEISLESGCGIVIERESLTLPDIVTTIAGAAGVDPIELAFGPGADFSLVGTMKQDIANKVVGSGSCPEFRTIGRVQKGAGVHITNGTATRPLRIKGWDYFAREIARP